MSASQWRASAALFTQRRIASIAAFACLAGAAGSVVGGNAGAVVGSKHDLSVAGGGATRATSETQPCVFCHTPHSANPARQLWNHAASSATYTTYGSSSFQSGATGGTFNTFPGRSAGQPTGSAKLCLSCHDGTIAVNATINNGSIAVGGSTFVPATASLGTDLSNDHPVSFRRTTANDQVVDPPAGDSARLEGGTGYVQCVSCHDPHDEKIDPTVRKFLVKVNQGSALCVTCHRKAGSGWSWQSSPHSTSAKSYTTVNTGGGAGLGAHTGYTTVAANGCESCHRAHTAPQAQRLLKAVAQASICYQCHGNPPVAAKNVAAVFGKASRHPLESSASTIVHDAAEVRVSPTNFAGARRHVDCADCHNPHGAAPGLHTPGSNQVLGVLAGVAGVEPASYPAGLPLTASYPLTSAAQTGYVLASPSAREYQICFKCHSSYAFGSAPPPSPSGGPQTDIAAEVNPNNRSYHPVVGAPHLRVPAGTSLLAPWNTTTVATRMYCTDCHGNDEATSAGVPQGAHGSSNQYMLRFANAAWSTTAPTLSAPTGFCVNCHSASTIRSTNRVHGVGDHSSRPCQACHAATPHGTFRPGLIALATDPQPYNKGAARIVSFTQAATPSGYQKSHCSTASGCH